MDFSMMSPTKNHVSSIQTIDWGVNLMMAPQSWKKTKGEGVKVAVLDTGIDRRHDDLSENLKGGINFTSGDMTDWDDRQSHGKRVPWINLI